MSDLSDAYAAVWDGQLGCFDASTVTIDGVAYACDEGERNHKQTRVSEGIFDEPACMLSIKQSLFTDSIPPSISKVVTFRGKSYKIDRISSPPDNTVFNFYLEPKK